VNEEALSAALESAWADAFRIDVQRGSSAAELQTVAAGASSPWVDTGAAVDGNTWFYQVPAVVEIVVERSGDDVMISWVDPVL
jgi:hypothetical protein